MLTAAVAAAHVAAKADKVVAVTEGERVVIEVGGATGASMEEVVEAAGERAAMAVEGRAAEGKEAAATVVAVAA